MRNTKVIRIAMIASLAGGGFLPTSNHSYATNHVVSTWVFCKTSYGPVGPRYIVPPGASRAGLYCSETFLSVGGAIGKACFLKSRGIGPWPQSTSNTPDYGISITC